MIVAYVLLAAPLVAAARFWGTWPWVAVAAAVAVAEYVTLQRSQQFAARIWRSIGLGKRSRNARGVEAAYVVSAIAGVGLLIASFLFVD